MVQGKHAGHIHLVSSQQMQKNTSLSLSCLLWFIVLPIVSAGEPDHQEAMDGSTAFMVSTQEPRCTAGGIITPGQRTHEKEFAGLGGSGSVTVAVTEKIAFSITMMDGTQSFCNVPWKIVQDGISYSITTTPAEEKDIAIEWSSFSTNGCVEISAGETATGTMSDFPPSFDVWASFRIYCGIWVHGDYFDIGPASPPPPGSTTSSTAVLSTTSLPFSTSTVPACPVVYLYGEHAAGTEAIRLLRDELLVKTPEGRELIHLYYQLSPLVVSVMRQDKEIESAIKQVIHELLKFSSYPVPQ